MSCLECLCCIDCVEGPDVLVVVEGGDDGDDVRLYQVLGHQAHHRQRTNHPTKRVIESSARD